MVGVNEENSSYPSSSRLSLYPNPVKDIITLRLKDKAQIYEYQVIDYSGKIKMKGFVGNRNGEGSINVSHLPEGIFLLIINDINGRISSSKFLKIN
jgi:hypothetical protein